MLSKAIYDNHMEIGVDDQSIASDTYNEVDDDTLAFICGFFASKGKDNKIFEWKSPGTFKTFYGDDFDNFLKYGQANIQCMGALRSGARVFGCRLLPPNATRANIVVSVAIAPKANIPQWKREDTVITGGSVTTLGTGSFVLDDTGAKIPIMIPNAATTEDPLDNIQLTLEGIQIELVKKSIDTYDTKGVPVFDGKSYSFTDTDDVEWTAYPLFMAYYYGRGKGGNNFGLTINRDSARDRMVSDGRRFILDVYEYDDSGNVKSVLDESVYFSFNPEALYSEDSNVSEGLVSAYSNTNDAGDDIPIQIIPYDNFTELTTAIYPHIGVGTSDDIDFIFAVDEDGVAYGKVVLATGSIDPSNTVVRLIGGSDGSLGLGETIKVDTVDTVVTQEMVDLAKKELLKQFYSCDIDNSIFDEKIIDADLIVDANYDDDIKKTILSEMPKYRDDIALIIDCGLTESYKEALTKAASITGYVDGDFDYMAYIGGQSGYTNDPSIPTPRHVTYTYDFVRTISEVFGTPAGRFQMIAGATNGKTKYMKYDWLAEKDKSNMLLKLEKAKINYIEKLNKRGDTMYSTERTLYDKDYSKLTSLRNALVIGDAKRVCHKVLIKYTYDPRSVAAAMEGATTELTSILRSRYPGTISVAVSIYQTKRDTITDNAHCDITFIFPNIIKRFTVTIIANREEIVAPAA